MGKIVSGFSNIGKSSILNYKDIKAIDFDASYFKKNEGWIDMYIECVLALLSKYDYVLITTHDDVLHEMNERGIPYTLVYPDISLKDEYKARTIKRGSAPGFVEGFFDMWDTHINDCIKNKYAKKIILESHQILMTFCLQ